MDKHVCKVCFKEFVCQAKLVEHIRVHTGERPFACKVCDSRFKSNSHLQRHIRSHSDARAHACPHGCAAYKRKCHLTRHLAEKHAGGELIRCPRCGATFTRIHGYRRHVVRVHSKQAPPAQGAKERAVFEALRRHDPRFYQVVRDTPLGCGVRRRPDGYFVIAVDAGGQVMVIFEVDERQHGDRKIGDELKRLEEIQERHGGPIYVVRYNPDQPGGLEEPKLAEFARRASEVLDTAHADAVGAFGGMLVEYHGFGDARLERLDKAYFDSQRTTTIPEA